MSTKVSTLPTEQGDQPKVHTFDTEDPNVSLVNHGIESNIDAKKLDDTNREGNGILGGSKVGTLEGDLETKQLAEVGEQPDTKSKEEHTEEDLKDMPVRQYLETTVVGIVMQGMQQLVRQRPEDPVAWLGDFLHRNNPKKRKAEELARVAKEKKTGEA
jgi:protein dpy-30